MIVKLMVDGGSMKPGPSIAQQLGPLGINLGKVISDVNTATESFNGMKVPVEIDVNPKTKQFSIHVFSPPVAELIKKEAGVEKGSGNPLETKIGNLAIEQIISVAKTKQTNMLAKDLRAAVKMVVGSCVSLGVMVEDRPAKEVEADIDAGIYDKEIKSGSIIVSADKKLRLTQAFAVIKGQQEAKAKAAEAAKLAEEAAKAAVAAATPAATAAAPGAAAGAAATPAATAAAPGAGAKPEAAKKEERPAKKKK
ncbi:MAG: 50S ribosomal protein L11 [Nanoarchaeota archaeon]